MPSHGSRSKRLRGTFGMQFLLDFVLKTHVFAAFEGRGYQDFTLGLLRSVCSGTRLGRDPVDSKRWRITSRRNQVLFKYTEDVC